jgi:hypothetical protein
VLLFGCCWGIARHRRQHQKPLASYISLSNIEESRGGYAAAVHNALVSNNNNNPDIGDYFSSGLVSAAQMGRTLSQNRREKLLRAQKS